MLCESMDMDNWKYYKEELNITTDSLWISNSSVPKNSKKFVIPKREILPKMTLIFMVYGYQRYHINL